MTRYAEDWTWSRQILRRVVLLGLVFVVLCAPSAGAAAGSARAPSAPTCSTARPGATGQPLPSTTVATIGEAYTCLLAHYPTGPTLDDRLLLHGAMAGLVAELLRLGADQPTAVLPDLRGNTTTDWRAFRRTYVAIAARLPRDERIQQGLAQATISGMVASLQDDHTRYAAPLVGVSGKTDGTPSGPAGSGEFGLGLRLSADPGLANRATAPLFIVAVDAGSPAARAGLRPGDVVVAINGLPPFIQGLVDQSVLAQLDRPGTIHLTIHRPGSSLSTTMALPQEGYPSPQPVTARVLPGDVAYVRLGSFVDNAANFVFAAIDGLGLGARLRGIVLDLRGNGGGSAEEPPRLLGALVHGKVFAYFEDGRGRRTAARTDATMPLVHVPLVVLIDRGCASACDVTAAAIRDLHLGRLVGERTAGDAAGPAEPWFLADGGVVQIPVAFMRGANGEIVDGIGVPPDETIPVTAAALAAGRDPGIDRALRDLQRTPTT